MTIAEIEEIFLEQMPGFYDREEVKVIASLAVQHVCGITRSYYLLHKREELLLAQETALIRILDELRFGRPVQHVLGEADFFGLRFKVGPHVLVPRPETEELVSWVLETIKAKNLMAGTMLDIGTGSGCIPISLKKHAAESEIYAIDISPEALEVARQNCSLNAVELNFLNADILDPEFTVSNSFDIIISNPPYVTQSEKSSMHEHVLRHEPHLALFVPDTEPLIFYQAITNFAEKHLSPQGLIFLEINERFGQETLNLLEEKGFKGELKKDLQGKDRMVKAFRK